MFKISALLILVLLAITPCNFQGSNDGQQDQIPETSHFVRAGVRASPYGPPPPFPNADYWINTCQSMASRFVDARASIIWILGTMEWIDGNFSGRCQLNFPASNQSFANITFASEDQNKIFLDRFEQEDIKVWLQIEPGNADVTTLINLILTRYSTYTCIIGMGVDVEWHQWSVANNEGVAVTDLQARAWLETTRSYNSNYTIFLKHWLPEKMPPTFRSGIVFISDSQIFTSLNQMMNEFRQWGQTFNPAPVGFQFGYPSDQCWWSQFSDPPLTIGQEILASIKNTCDLYWVDFTMKDIWPNQ